MKQPGSLAGVDFGVYVRAFALLARNPSIIVVPLLMAIIGVLLGMVLTPIGGGSAQAFGTSGLAGLISALLTMFGLGTACIIADDAWRRGRASFDRGWEEARRRAGDILMAAIGVTLLFTVASYAGLLLGPLALLLLAAAVYFLLWAIPAAAVGGIPGGAAIQVSIERVRGAPVLAAVTAVVAMAAIFVSVSVLPGYAIGWLPARTSALVPALLEALFQSIGIGYVALILTKTYTDAAFGTRRW